MRVFEAMADAFVNEGVSKVFTLMGDGNKLWLYAMSQREGVELIHVRHEGAALAMADGTARIGGGVGVCSVTYATGVTQLATSLGVASKARSPIVVMAADTPSIERGMGGPHDVDVRLVIQGTGAIIHEVRSAATAVDDVHIAFHRARTQRRPLVLLCRSDLLEAPVPTVNAQDTGPSRGVAVSNMSSPSPQALEQAVEIIARSKRCVVLLGRGAKLSNASAAASRLANSLGAIVATTLPGKGLLDSHQFSVGIAGTYSLPHARRLLPEADCVVALGASLNMHTFAYGEFFKDASIVQVDTAQQPEIAEGRFAHCYVRADAGIGATALAENARPAARWQSGELAEMLANDQRLEELDGPAPSMPTGTVDPRQLLMRLDEVLPTSGTFIIGAGHFTSFPVMYLRNPVARDFHTILDFATIGQTLPTAIGASLGNARHPVIAFEGDASVMMHLQELETAVRYEAPILLLVLNDGLLGAEYHKLQQLGLNPRETVLPTADLVDLAQAFGVRARRLTSVDDAGDIADWFEPDLGPHLVDCAIAPTVVGPMSPLAEIGLDA